MSFIISYFYFVFICFFFDFTLNGYINKRNNIDNFWRNKKIKNNHIIGNKIIIEILLINLAIEIYWYSNVLSH